MDNNENKDTPRLFGPDKLTAEQLQEMPKDKRQKYISKMTAQETGNYFTAGFVKTLNAQHKE